MPADSTASSYPCYVQLAFPNGTMFVFKKFSATPEDWTTLFSLVDSDHTIIISFNGADDWVGIYVLLGTQFCIDRQKKNKETVVKVIHLDAYRVIRNINNYPPLYELAPKIAPRALFQKSMAPRRYSCTIFWTPPKLTTG
uniref:Uncharacterized protein n=1 Tax=Romanomermis culicivorax TaxID=13658 RepID=A0A915I9F5_ROMCU